MSHATPTDFPPLPERALPTERRIAAVELLQSLGYRWHEGAWVAPAEPANMRLAGWLEADPGTTVCHVADIVPVNLIRSTKLHLTKERPKPGNPNNSLFPLYTPAAIDPTVCHTCEGEPIIATTGEGPFRCWTCGVTAVDPDRAAAGESAP